MTSLNTMLSSRSTAGERYANAVTELRAAMVDLWAIDLAIMNRHVGVPSSQAVETFSGENTEIPTGFRHPKYASASLGGIHNDAETKSDTYLAALKEG